MSPRDATSPIYNGKSFLDGLEIMYRQRSIEDEHDEVDKEYRPPGPNEEELNSSDEEDDEDEYTHMAPGRRRQCNAGTQESVPDRTSSQHEIVASQPNLSSPPTTDSSVASSSRRVRGRVVGHESEKRMRILGSRISVPLGAASGAFEGEYASTFAIELGSHIRRLVPLNKETWAAIDDGCKEAIFTAAAQKYDFGDWKTDARVVIAVGKLAMHTYREFRAELHKAYKKLLEKGHDPKQYPYDTQRAAQWVWLIENKWETPEWKRKSQRNSESRSKVKTLHTAGSRSFAAQFSIMQADEQQATPSQADLYRQQHYSKKKGRWITDHAEETHRRMEEALSQPEINSPVAEQQVIENLLGKRVARRQGYRSRGPSSSSASILVSSEMSTLRQQLADSLKAQEELRRQYEESQKQMQDQAAMQI
ncbi:hypothetical protein AAC387_Pa05g1247 [Persea americana]